MIGLSGFGIFGNFSFQIVIRFEHFKNDFLSRQSNDTLLENAHTLLHTRYGGHEPSMSYAKLLDTMLEHVGQLFSYTVWRPK